MVLISGYETTASTLQFIIFILSKLSDIQERVRDEINEVVGDRPEITYEDLGKMNYMWQVVQETLRMYPPIQR